VERDAAHDLDPALGVGHLTSSPLNVGFVSGRKLGNHLRECSRHGVLLRTMAMRTTWGRASCRYVIEITAAVSGAAAVSASTSPLAGQPIAWPGVDSGIGASSPAAVAPKIDHMGDFLGNKFNSTTTAGIG
jgi:hypothetical protein